MQAGATLQVSVTTKNAGRSRSAASTTKVYLSADRSVGGDIAVATVQVPRLRPGRQNVARPTLRVPASAAVRELPRDCVRRHPQAGARVERSATTAGWPTARSGSPRPPPEVPDFPLDPDPITVDPDPDEARAVSETIYDTTQSTTIKATGADGTTYTLVIPAGALVGPETITLTPLAKVDDLPLSGGLEAAVELEPHGLVLLKQATLTIDSPSLGPIAQQTPFYFHEGGEDFHLYPTCCPSPATTPAWCGSRSSTSRPRRRLSATSADRAGFGSHPTARDQGQIAGQIADLIRKAREADPERRRGITDPSSRAQIEAIMNATTTAPSSRDWSTPRPTPATPVPPSPPSMTPCPGCAPCSSTSTGGGDLDLDRTRMRDAFDRALAGLHRGLQLTRWKRCSEEHELEMLPLLLAVCPAGSVLGLLVGPTAAERAVQGLLAVRAPLRLEGVLRRDLAAGRRGALQVPAHRARGLAGKGDGHQRPGREHLHQSGELPLTPATYHDSTAIPVRRHDLLRRSRPDRLHAGDDAHHRARVVQAQPAGGAARPRWHWSPSCGSGHQLDADRRHGHSRTLDCGGGDYTDSTTSRWLSQFLTSTAGSASIS